MSNSNENYCVNGDSLTESFNRSYGSSSNQSQNIDPSKFTVTSSGQVIKPQGEKKK